MNRSERGGTYVTAAVVIMLLCTVFSAVLCYSECMSTVKNIKTRVGGALDACILENSIEYYGALDDGHDVSPSALKDGFYSMLELRFSELCVESKRYSMYIDGALQYSFSKPVLSQTEKDKNRLRAAYSVFIPVRFFGIQIFTAEIPVENLSKYITKLK